MTYYLVVWVASLSHRCHMRLPYTDDVFYPSQRSRHGRSGSGDVNVGITIDFFPLRRRLPPGYGSLASLHRSESLYCSASQSLNRVLSSKIHGW